MIIKYQSGDRERYIEIEEKKGGRRGGARIGAGRPRQGVTKKVSITLDPDAWKWLQSQDGSISAVLRSLVLEKKRSQQE